MQPVYAPSAIAARGYTRKFRFLPGAPGYVTVSRRLVTDVVELPRSSLEVVYSTTFNNYFNFFMPVMSLM